MDSREVKVSKIDGQAYYFALIDNRQRLLVASSLSFDTAASLVCDLSEPADDFVTASNHLLIKAGKFLFHYTVAAGKESFDLVFDQKVALSEWSGPSSSRSFFVSSGEELLVVTVRHEESKLAVTKVALEKIHARSITERPLDPIKDYFLLRQEIKMDLLEATTIKPRGPRSYVLFHLSCCGMQADSVVVYCLDENARLFEFAKVVDFPLPRLVVRPLGRERAAVICYDKLHQGPMSLHLLGEDLKPVHIPLALKGPCTLLLSEPSSAPGRVHFLLEHADEGGLLYSLAGDEKLAKELLPCLRYLAPAPRAYLLCIGDNDKCLIYAKEPAQPVFVKMGEDHHRIAYFNNGGGSRQSIERETRIESGVDSRRLTFLPDYPFATFTPQLESQAPRAMVDQVELSEFASRLFSMDVFKLDHFIEYRLNSQCYVLEVPGLQNKLGFALESDGYGKLHFRSFSLPSPVRKFAFSAKAWEGGQLPAFPTSAVLSPNAVYLLSKYQTIIAKRNPLDSAKPLLCEKTFEHQLRTVYPLNSDGLALIEFYDGDSILVQALDDGQSRTRQAPKTSFTKHFQFGYAAHNVQKVLNIFLDDLGHLYYLAVDRSYGSKCNVNDLQLRNLSFGLCETHWNAYGVLDERAQSVGVVLYFMENEDAPSLRYLVLEAGLQVEHERDLQHYVSALSNYQRRDISCLLPKGLHEEGRGDLRMLSLSGVVSMDHALRGSRAASLCRVNVLGGKPARWERVEPGYVLYNQIAIDLSEDTSARREPQSLEALIQMVVDAESKGGQRIAGDEPSWRAFQSQPPSDLPFSLLYDEERLFICAAPQEPVSEFIARHVLIK